MKKKSNHRLKSVATQTSRDPISRDQNVPTFARPEPSEASIRERAYEIYEKANHCNGHHIDHWFEASAQLKEKSLESSSPSPQLIGI